MAIDAEYTITSPTRRAAAPPTPSAAVVLRRSARCARRRQRLAQHCASAFTAAREHLAALAVVAEHVEARARRREQHRVARPGEPRCALRPPPRASGALDGTPLDASASRSAAHRGRSARTARGMRAHRLGAAARNPAPCRRRRAISTHLACRGRAARRRSRRRWCPWNRRRTSTPPRVRDALAPGAAGPRSSRSASTQGARGRPSVAPERSAASALAALCSPRSASSASGMSGVAPCASQRAAAPSSPQSSSSGGASSPKVTTLRPGSAHRHASAGRRGSAPARRAPCEDARLRRAHSRRGPRSGRDGPR